MGKNCDFFTLKARKALELFYAGQGGPPRLSAVTPARGDRNNLKM